VEAVNAVLRSSGGEEFATSRIEGEEGLHRAVEESEEGRVEVDREAEYVDEDKFTTVTVEAVDVDRDGLKRVAHSVVEDEEQLGDVETDEKLPEDASQGQASRRDADGKRIWTKEAPRFSKHKTKKRQFKYESKAERKITRYKERGKSKKQAKERKGK